MDLPLSGCIRAVNTTNEHIDCNLSPRRVWITVFVHPTLTYFFSPLMAEHVSVTWKQESTSTGDGVWFTWCWALDLTLAVLLHVVAFAEEENG